jgi:glutathione S-transferase
MTIELHGVSASPYVRRVAVTLNFYGIAFTHRPDSVFRDYAAIKSINPAVKVPTLVLDDGTVLTESTLIISYFERANPDRPMHPDDPADLARSLWIIGMALTACDKAIQLIYERTVRPPETAHQPWIDRVTDQLNGACRALNAACERDSPWIFGTTPLQADITAAVAWKFLSELPETSQLMDLSNLIALSVRSESLDAFAAFPK